MRKPPGKKSQPLPKSFKDLTPAKHFNPRTFFHEMVLKTLLTRRTGQHRSPIFPKLNPGQVAVTFRDDRSGLDPASLADPDNYLMIGPLSRPGQVLRVRSIALGPTAGPTSPRSVLLTLNGGRPLPHGRYVLVVASGGVRDLSGNPLDGEFSGSFPSGDGRPGGNFSALFTFDGRQIHPLTPAQTASAPTETATAQMP